MDTDSTGNFLSKVVGVATGDPRTNGNPADYSFGVTFDHAEPAIETQMASSVDSSGLMGGRRKADEAAAGYDGINQASGKYNFKTPLRAFVYGESFNGATLTATEWENIPGSTLGFNWDAPVKPPCLDNLTFPFKEGTLITQIATYQNPAGYNFADAYATRKQFRLQATVKHYASAGLFPIGHGDGSVAVNANAGAVHAVAGSKLMSNHFQKPYKGTRLLIAYSYAALSQQQVEEVQVNAYKLLVA